MRFRSADSLVSYGRPICVKKTGVSVRLSRMKRKTNDTEKGKKNIQPKKSKKHTDTDTQNEKNCVSRTCNFAQVQPVFNAFLESPVLYLISISFFSPAMQSGIKKFNFNNKFHVVKQQHHHPYFYIVFNIGFAVKWN